MGMGRGGWWGNGVGGEGGVREWLNGWPDGPRRWGGGNLSKYENNYSLIGLPNNIRKSGEEWQMEQQKSKMYVL